MRILISLLLSFSLLLSISVEKEIKQNKRALSVKKVQYKKMDKQLSSIARKIVSAKKEQKKLNAKLSLLAKNIKNNEASFLRLKREEKVIALNLNKVTDSINKKQKVFLDLVAKNFSLALALEELDQQTPDSVVMKEVYELYAKRNREDIHALKSEIDSLKSKKHHLKVQQSNMSDAIHRYENERKEYKVKKLKQDKLVKALARDKAIYKKRFYKIKASRNRLEEKLANLKIIKLNSDQEARDRAEQLAIKQSSHARATTHTAPKIIVAAPSAKYTGGKTISPLKGGRLIKKFGTYIDPVYKFKIFNKSITLKAPHVGAKVRSVLGGKIVFAENSGGMLGKVVIVEHANKIHTIYAKLSRLAPGIHVGKQLSSGTIIGKVDKSLMFEVTKNNKHMNPMKLIRL